MTGQTELELIELSDRHLEVLAAAAGHGGTADADGRTLAALRRRGLLGERNDITELGRYQVRWYADDCARAWGIEVNTWHQYVKRGTAPEAAARGTFGSSVDRPWWRPLDVTTYERPGVGHRAGQRTANLSDVDMPAIERRFRAGESVRALAKAYSVAPATLAARLEERGVKPETTASRAERQRRMAGNNPTSNLPHDWTY